MPLAPTTAHWRHEFVLVREMRAIGREAELAQQVRSGQLVPVARGVYRRREYIEQDPVLQRADAFRARVRATHLLWDGELVFAGFASAAVWSLPIVGQTPDRIDVASLPAAGGRSNAALRRSYVPDATDFQLIDGIKVTPLARTAVDVARWGSFTQGVAVCDAALHGAERTRTAPAREPLAMEELADAVRTLGQVPGKRNCAGVVAFASAGSESPGESVSRVAMRLLGLPDPILQQSFRDDAGIIGVVDFWWPEFNLIGEFDGDGKYLRDEYTRGADAASIVMKEKYRENRLRATLTKPNVVRWGWGDANSLPRLRATLCSAGLPESTRRR